MTAGTARQFSQFNENETESPHLASHRTGGLKS
jgi:hypothetical protein